MWIILVVLMVATLHVSTFLFTHGQIRTPASMLWFPPLSLQEDFNTALFKLGKSCLEASQSFGLITEADPITIPAPQNGFNILEKATGNGIKRRNGVVSQTGRSVHFLLYKTLWDLAVFVVNKAALKIVPRHWRLHEKLLSMNGADFRDGKRDAGNNARNGLISHSRADEASGLIHQESETSDEDFAPSENDSSQISSSDSEHNSESENEMFHELFDLAKDMSHFNEISQDEIPQRMSIWMSASPRALRSSFSSSLKQRLPSRNLQLEQGPFSNSSLGESSQPAETGFSRRMCVVCYSETRSIVLKPCGCLALCDDCRQALAMRKFKECPCCRSLVEGGFTFYLFNFASFQLTSLLSLFTHL